MIIPFARHRTFFSKLWKCCILLMGNSVHLYSDQCEAFHVIYSLVLYGITSYNMVIYLINVVHVSLCTCQLVHVPSCLLPFSFAFVIALQENNTSQQNIKC